MIDSIVDSMKTYGMVLLGYLAMFMDLACGVVQKLTIILVFVGLIVRLVSDIPKAMDSVRRMKKGRGK